MNKTEIRKQYLKLRKEIIDREDKNKKIMGRIIDTEIYKNSQVIGIYVSTDCEVDTIELIKYSLCIGKIVCVPVVNGGTMLFYKIDSIDALDSKNKYGILEPDPNNSICINGDFIDLFIMPIVSFDKSRNRIGYGGGYYDKYLNNLPGVKIGIAFSIQKAEKIIAEQTDVRPDTIITEHDIFTNMKMYATIDDVKRALKKKSTVNLF